MKKFMFLSVLALSLTMGSSSRAAVLDTLLLYIPNRAVDFVDTFSVCLGFGPAAHGHVWVTRAVGFGGGVGATAQVVKEINRQYGTALIDGWESSFMVISAEDKKLTEGTRGVKDYYYYSTGIPLPDEQIYNFYDGARDYWSFGVHAALLGELQLEFHPVELGDFVSGFFFIDLKGDDFTADDLRL